MDSEAAVLSAVTVQGALRVLEVTLHLFAYLFPKQAKITANSRYDFIIVGAGSAGCLLARRLSDNKDVSVLLIEAGDNPTLEVMMPGLTLYNQNSSFDWKYKAANDKYAYQCYKDKVFRTARGHGIGGSGGLNYLLYARGAPEDFEKWADISGDSTWRYDNVLPYFKKGERLENWMVLHSKYRHFHGTEGEMGINIVPDAGKLKYMNALNEVGYKTVLDTNGNDTLGFTFPMYNVAKGIRQHSCYCYVSPVRGRKNLHVLRNTKVRKVMFRGNRAIGVEIKNSNTTSIIIKANLEVILSAGAFNSPQLLMLSGIGPKKHLQSFNIPTIVDLPVGYNLLDHTGVIIAHQTGTYNEDDAQFNPLNPALLTINGFVALNKSQSYPDAQFIMASSINPQSFIQLFSFSLQIEDDIAQIAYDANKEKEVLFTYILNLRPLSLGRVMLRSADPNDHPEIHLNTFSKKKDLQNMKRYIKDYLRLEKSTYFKSVKAKRIDLAGKRCKAFKKDSEEYWDCYCLCIMISMYHYSGTCAMSSVVDSNMRVMGVHGLRVVDTSVFPSLPSANTNAAAIMVAEKAADMIKSDYCI